MKRSGNEDPHTLAGSYALDALSSEERRRFERHLKRCEVCRRDVRDYGETAALLGNAAARTPPEELRNRVLQAVSTTRQLPPRSGSPRSDKSSKNRRASETGWWTRTTMTLAACMVVILALSAGLVWQNQSMKEMHHEEREIAAILAAEDANYTSNQAHGATLGAVSSREHGAVVVTARGLSKLEDREYQVWLSDPDGSMRSGGMLSVDADGTDMMMVGDVGEAQEIAITAEPEGGSARPTSEPMMSIPVGDVTG